MIKLIKIKVYKNSRLLTYFFIFVLSSRIPKRMPTESLTLCGSKIDEDKVKIKLLNYPFKKSDTILLAY